jgi:hypothetical protein
MWSLEEKSMKVKGGHSGNRKGTSRMGKQESIMGDKYDKNLLYYIIS